jgi:hypothetical protein
MNYLKKIISGLGVAVLVMALSVGSGFAADALYGAYMHGDNLEVQEVSGGEEVVVGTYTVVATKDINLSSLLVYVDSGLEDEYFTVKAISGMEEFGPAKFVNGRAVVKMNEDMVDGEIRMFELKVAVDPATPQGFAKFGARANFKGGKAKFGYIWGDGVEIEGEIQEPESFVIVEPLNTSDDSGIVYAGEEDVLIGSYHLENHRESDVEIRDFSINLNGELDGAYLDAGAVIDEVKLVGPGGLVLANTAVVDNVVYFNDSFEIEGLDDMELALVADVSPYFDIANLSGMSFSPQFGFLQGVEGDTGEYFDFEYGGAFDPVSIFVVRKSRLSYSVIGDVAPLYNGYRELLGFKFNTVGDVASVGLMRFHIENVDGDMNVSDFVLTDESGEVLDAEITVVQNENVWDVKFVLNEEFLVADSEMLRLKALVTGVSDNSVMHVEFIPFAKGTPLVQTHTFAEVNNEFFKWSDLSALAHSFESSDWTNSYLVKTNGPTGRTLTTLF